MAFNLGWGGPLGVAPLCARGHSGRTVQHVVTGKATSGRVSQVTIKNLKKSIPTHPVPGALRTGDFKQVTATCISTGTRHQGAPYARFPKETSQCSSDRRGRNRDDVVTGFIWVKNFRLGAGGEDEGSRRPGAILLSVIWPLAGRGFGGKWASPSLRETGGGARCQPKRAPHFSLTNQIHSLCN